MCGPDGGRLRPPTVGAGAAGNTRLGKFRQDSPAWTSAYWTIDTSVPSISSAVVIVRELAW
jgi:hypothetical protein